MAKVCGQCLRTTPTTIKTVITQTTKKRIITIAADQRIRQTVTKKTII